MIAEQYRIFGVRIATRKARRWLVAIYWALMLVVCIGFVRHQAHHGVEDMRPWGFLPIFVGIVSLLGGVKVGGAVKLFSGRQYMASPTPGDEGGLTLFRHQSIYPPDANGALDERERNERDTVHYTAYTIVRWLTLALFFLYAWFGAAHAAWFPRVGPFFIFLLTLVLWSLPQSLILWTEPDVEEAQ